MPRTVCLLTLLHRTEGSCRCPSISLKNAKDSHCSSSMSKQEEILGPNRANLMVFSLPFEARKCPQVSSRRVLCRAESQLLGIAGLHVAPGWPDSWTPRGFRRPLLSSERRKRRRLQQKWQQRDHCSRAWQRVNSAQASSWLAAIKQCVFSPPLARCTAKHKGEPSSCQTSIGMTCN